METCMSEVKSEAEGCWPMGIRQITLGLLCTCAKRLFMAAKFRSFESATKRLALTTINTNVGILEWVLCSSLSARTSALIWKGHDHKGPPEQPLPATKTFCWAHQHLGWDWSALNYGVCKGFAPTLTLPPKNKRTFECDGRGGEEWSHLAGWVFLFVATACDMPCDLIKMQRNTTFHKLAKNDTRERIWRKVYRTDPLIKVSGLLKGTFHWCWMTMEFVDTYSAHISRQKDRVMTVRCETHIPDFS